MTEHESPESPEPPAPDQPPGEGPSPAPGAPTEAAASAHYQVLARKYRPATFAGLIGQEAMVRTLTNAMTSGRLAHAFILTGVRGVGKTTAARIIARCLNCVGPDGSGGITPEPCGVCEHCRAIAEDRHMDVIEMDAASRTGVDDIRELIDGVRYRPTSARYKVYIIDEVHMLSKHAFNALLKTLEEPPEHVKFIFATTEVRKIPVTVLSRCQRFDLRRIDAETLAAHFKGIVEKEGAKVTDGALAMIVRAADGSVRDGLSLFDQAIAHCGGEVGEDQVRQMLGLADRTITFDLLDAVMKGDADKALRTLGQQYAAGADPAVVLEDMLELTHWLTRIKVVPGAADAFGVPEAERVRGGEMAEKLSMAAMETILVIVLTPAFWVLAQFFGLFGTPDFGFLEDALQQNQEFLDANAERTDRQSLQFPGWMGNALRLGLFALLIIGGFWIGRFLFRRAPGGDPDDYDELRMSTGSGGGTSGLLRNLLPGLGRRTRTENWTDRHAVYRLFGRVVGDSDERGFPRRTGETPLEFASIAGRTLDAPAFGGIAEAFDRARYGRHYAGDDEVRELEQALNSWEQTHPATEEWRREVAREEAQEEVRPEPELATPAEDEADMPERMGPI
ncbi:MAG: DNA polymerase III subunit gamma/tau [Proteobacteria bacterium]|nr:DNA polymerase III subunit gamma/tau [Pseudomonadota bacterium]